jgi:hypothetical protein
MAAGGLPPPPTRAGAGDFVWVAWYNQLRNYLSTGGSVAWAVVNKAGSSIADLQSKAHDLLTGLQGGTTNEHYHLTAAEHTALGSIPNHNTLGSIQGGVVNEYYHLTSAEYTGTGTGVFVRKDSAQLTGPVTFTGTIQPTTAGGYKSSDGSVGFTGTVTTASLVGKTITIKDGLITNVA